MSWPRIFADEMLITYPVERSRLDVFSQLLIPAKVEPRAIRQVELTAVILLLVASNRGVAVLPDWVVREVRYNSDYVTRPLTKSGLTRRLFAAVRDEDVEKPFMANVVNLARKFDRAFRVACLSSHALAPAYGQAYRAGPHQEGPMIGSANLNIMIKAARRPAGRLQRIFARSKTCRCR